MSFLKKTGSAIKSGAEKTGSAIKGGAEKTGSAIKGGAKATGSGIERGANVVYHQALKPTAKGIGNAVEIGITNPAQAVYHYEKERFVRARGVAFKDVISASVDVPFVASQVGYLFGMKPGGQDEALVRKITNSALPFMPYGSGYMMMGANYTAQYQNPERKGIHKSVAEKKQIRRREKRGSKNPNKKTGFGGNSRNDGSIPIYLA